MDFFLYTQGMDIAVVGKREKDGIREQIHNNIRFDGRLQYVLVRGVEQCARVYVSFIGVDLGVFSSPNIRLPPVYGCINM